MVEWDVIAFGDIDDETSSVKRVTASNEDEAMGVFGGRFAVAFPVRDSGSGRPSHSANRQKENEFQNGFRSYARTSECNMGMPSRH